MENRMKIGLLLALSLVAPLSAPLSAQRGSSHGGSRMHAGGGYSGGTAGPVMRASAFTPAYSSYYPRTYGFGMPFAYMTNPYPEDPNGGPAVIVSSPPVPNAELNVVYIPSYMRPSNGPSLGEIAAQLKTEHQPAKYIWRNVEPQLQPKEDSK
jgi:hypothetical protein